jgi:hypothetical protein
MPDTLHDWFYMHDGRNSFQPRLPADADLLFCHKDIIDGTVIPSIERAFGTAKPVKMILYGDWGSGKTHTLYYTRRWLEQHVSDYPSRAEIIQIGDITKKSRFDQIVRPFLDKLGRDWLVKLVSDFRTRNPDVLQALRNCGVSYHVADAITKFQIAVPGQPVPPVVEQAFAYLKGAKLPPNNSGFGDPLEQSKDFYDVLLAVGYMFKSVHAQQFIFIADEAAKLELVEGDESVHSHWVSAHRLIFDAENDVFGFIYTVSGQRKQLPRALTEEQITNRIGNNMIELQSLPKQDVEAFVRDLVNSFVDRARVEAAAKSGEVPTADFDWSIYPFDRDGWNKFLEFFANTQLEAKPRVITDKMDEAGFFALKAKSRLIGVKQVEKAQM